MKINFHTQTLFLRFKVCRYWKGKVNDMKIVVLAGGTSTERDVSLVTGSMIYKALVRNGHQAVLLDVYLGYEGRFCRAF